MMRILSSVLLLFISLTASAALTTGPDVPVSGVVIAGTDAQPYALAGDGTDFLTVWRDVTPGREGMYATIVTETGATRPLAPARLDPGYTSFVQAVWTGDAYLVVISRLDSLVTLRLNRDGELLSRAGIASGPTHIFDLAWNGKHALAIVLGADGARTGMLLDASGHIVRSGIALPFDRTPSAFAVAAAGESFIVTWTEELEPAQSGVSPLSVARAVLISDDGQVGAQAQLTAPARGYAYLDAATGYGDRAGITVEVTNPVPGHTLARFTISEAFAVQSDPVVHLESGSFDVRVVSTQLGFVAAWTLHRGGPSPFIGSIRFHSPLDHAVVLTPFNIVGFGIVSNNHTVLATFGGAPLRGVVLDSTVSERLSDVVPIATAVVRQSNPAIGTAGNTSLYAWVESTPSYPGVVRARRFDADGNALDAQPLTLGAGTEEFTPAVAFTGKVWIVAWTPANTGNTRVVMQRISPQGVLLDPAPVDIGPGFQPVIATNGQSAVVATTADNRFGIHLIRLSADGVRLDPEAVKVGGTAADAPAIGTNGQEYLVTWSAVFRDVHGIRLAANGTPLDATPIVIANGELNDGDSYVASDGTDFLVAYTSVLPPFRGDPPLENPPPTIYTVYTKRVLRNGTLAGTISAQDGSRLGEGTDPRLTFTDGRYLATFVQHDFRAVTDFSPSILSILAVPTNTRGQALGPATSVLITESYSPVHTLATVGDSTWLAYARLAPDLGGVQRVFTRELLTEGTPRRRAARR